MNIFDFFMEATGDIAKQRLRLFGIQFLLVVDIIIFLIFVRNLIITTKWLYYDLVAYNIALLIVTCMFIGLPINCRITIRLFQFNMGFIMVCNGLILLQKVYLALCRQKWILYISTPSRRKSWLYDLLPSFFLWYWFAINVPINILFSIIFCHIALKQYRLFGSEAWKKLARDGIQTMFLVTLCSIICSIIVILLKDKINADTFFIIDYVVVTTILVNHFKNFGKNTKSAHRPKTNHMLNLSQIATATSIN
ncbi:hypothetical protein BDF19DRAFT_445290 [Syncephalis fuscata]|nr:hypothetical protein BDF19DRAFT_445290 [Syncephalis fuscata]